MEVSTRGGEGSGKGELGGAKGEVGGNSALVVGGIDASVILRCQYSFDNATFCAALRIYGGWECCSNSCLVTTLLYHTCDTLH